MKRARLIALGILVLCLVSLGTAIFLKAGSKAKRGRAPAVPPVEIGGIEYRAPNTVDTKGCIEAWDTRTDTLLWRKKVYHTLWIPFEEEDVQWVFIKSMTVGPSGNELIVVNEAGDAYTVKTDPRMQPGTAAMIGIVLLVCAIAVLLLARARKTKRESGYSKI
ncbi:MAG TPA: hypothetical protein VGI88_00135 [Verrucomicrobiae bacterium]